MAAQDEETPDQGYSDSYILTTIGLAINRSRGYRLATTQGLDHRLKALYSKNIAEEVLKTLRSLDIL